MTNTQNSTQQLLKELIKQTYKLQNRIETIQETQQKILAALDQTTTVNMPMNNKNNGDNVMDVMTLLSLPDHLRKTAMVINKTQAATADQVAKITKRTRAIESSYLNQLVRLNYITKTKKGHNVYFHVRGYEKWAKL